MMNERKTPTLRKLAIYGFDLVAGSHNFLALLEFDISGLRSALRKARQAGGGGSLFAFMLKAIGKCLEEYPEFNSMINLRKIATFEEVDVNIPIEIEADGGYATKQYIVRNINSKTIAQVSKEIEDSKNAVDGAQGFVDSAFAQKILGLLPRRIVMAIFRLALRSHRRVKELSGTVFVTSVSMFSSVPGFVVPYSGGPKAVSFAIGSSLKKAVVRDGEIRVREMINVSASFNHDIVDGAPAARFINRLRKYIEVDFESLL